MFYKVIYDNKVIDALDRLVCLRYRTKHNRMVLCKEDKAQAILSSDGKTIWHVEGFYDLPVSVSNEYDTISLVKIDEYEYRQLKALNGKTVEEVIDDFVELMLGNKIGLLMDSLKRLYENNRIDEAKVIELCDNGYITNEQKKYVLGS